MTYCYVFAVNYLGVGKNILLRGQNKLIGSDVVYRQVHGHLLSWDAYLARAVEEGVLFKEIRCQILNRCLLSMYELNFFNVLYYSQVSVNFNGNSKNPG